MLAMLCTRCQQREAKIRGPAPERRAKLEALFGAPWPFPDDICMPCAKELLKDPDFRARFDAFRKAAWAKTRGRIAKDLRAAALKALDFADRLAGKS